MDRALEAFIRLSAEALAKDIASMVAGTWWQPAEALKNADLRAVVASILEVPAEPVFLEAIEETTWGSDGNVVIRLESGETTKLGMSVFRLLFRPLNRRDFIVDTLEEEP